MKKPRTVQKFRVPLILVVALASAGLGQAARLPAPPADAAGLVPQRAFGLDEFALLPGARLADYRRVLVQPVEVRFNSSWAREHREVDAAETRRLLADIAKLAGQEIGRVLQRDGGYALAEAAGEGVLELRSSIVDLDISAPDIQDAMIRRDYVLSAGEATLVMELRDSLTGKLLARLADQREMRRYPDLQLANSVTNSAETRDLVGAWARLLRRQLDTAKSDSKGS